MAPPPAGGPHRVIIVGGGFAGLYATKTLGRAPVQVTLVDRRNFHLFQPLLYQVATGGLSPGDIASPLRAVLKRWRHIEVLAAEVIGLDPGQRRVQLRDRFLDYDSLILAAGSSHHYFGNDAWAPLAPGLKSIEDALEIRRRVLLAFETAEREPDPERRQSWLRFVVVGGGPTGVELCGALAELARGTLKGEFRRIDPRAAEVILVEGSDRLLPSYPQRLSARAESSLRRLGVTVRTGARVIQLEAGRAVVQQGDRLDEIRAGTVLWAAGMQASPLGRLVAAASGTELDRAGRVVVAEDLSLPGHPEVFVIGDLASFGHQGERPLAAVAPVAMQQGTYVARRIARRLQGKQTPAFRYRNRGSLAVIGRNAAVADLGFLRFSGWPAWFAWVFVHIGYLIGFGNKLLVLFQWALNYLTRNRGARLITGQEVEPPVGPPG